MITIIVTIITMIIMIMIAAVVMKIKLTSIDDESNSKTTLIIIPTALIMIATIKQHR